MWAGIAHNLRTSPTKRRPFCRPISSMPSPIVATSTAMRSILACDRAGITVTLPKPMTSGAKSEGRFGKQDFVYLPEEDVYRCPAGEKLKYSFTAEEHGQKLRRYTTNACRSCAIKAAPGGDPSLKYRAPSWALSANADDSDRPRKAPGSNPKSQPQNHANMAVLERVRPVRVRSWPVSKRFCATKTHSGHSQDRTSRSAAVRHHTLGCDYPPAQWTRSCIGDQWDQDDFDVCLRRALWLAVSSRPKLRP